MIGTENCVYKTPCGWCSKWDKECDKKIHKPNESVNTAVVKKCESESDHEWEGCGISTTEISYICKKCGARKTIPMDYSLCNELTIPYFEQSWTCTATSNTTKLD